MINLKYSAWADMLGLRPRPIANRAQPKVGDVFVCRTENGPIEYAQVIGVYEEAAQIEHIRFRLVYGYQDKTAEMGERTLAAELFHKRVTRRFETSDAE
ncbi:MAG: hypothetical protein OSB76_00610 [Alphaproteobacteria bacterium]|nr:hypothetical protein [Alphaproteobacteria bacterium]